MHKSKIVRLVIIGITFSGWTVFGQLNEIAHVVDTSVIEHDISGDVNIHIGRSEMYPLDYHPEGTAILVKNVPKDLDVYFRYFDAHLNTSAWIRGNKYDLPDSVKTFLYTRHEASQSSIMFEYKITSSHELPSIMSAGIFLPDLEEYPDIGIRGRSIENDLPKPTIITRAEWGARAPTHGYSLHPYYTKLTLHHAAGFSASNIEEGKEQMRAIQDLHQFVRGWSDIGYHFVVDKAGYIYQGRPETVIGAHVMDNNTGNIGVCVLGCYHPPEPYCGDHLTEDTINSLVALYAWISGEYNYDPSVLRGHRDYPYNDTSCPGHNIYDKLPELRNDIGRYVELGGYPLEYIVSNNYPNPFNRQTIITYDVPTDNHIKIVVYDLLGREVQTLMDNVQTKGHHTIEWDGRTHDGNISSSGIYFLYLTSNEFTDVQKMSFIK
ncbi:MAG: N-acetylmuramoyl-L-alanine amidase [Candidatus Marinimicrobia bacterium]|nr:N-acetylmuramoyl-L-alanine amidase [Candidatus Neomarinimicrobiota bacterium]